MKFPQLVTTRIVTFQDEYLPYFIEFNKQWIRNYFEIEPMDIYQLEQAKTAILDKGGEIFFLLEGDEVVGTCAMVPHGPGCYELAKMAVSVDSRGKGYGNLLMEQAIRWAKEKGANQVMLLSNTLLAPAISLYRKYGFQTTRLGNHPDYQRSNIEMTLQF